MYLKNLRIVILDNSWELYQGDVLISCLTVTVWSQLHTGTHTHSLIVLGYGLMICANLSFKHRSKN